MYEPIKDLGQNFLIDFTVVTKLVDALKLNSEEIIIEIGAGLGVLTDALSKRLAGKNTRLLAIEIDYRFTPKLSAMFVYEPLVEIVEADILDWLPKFNTEKEYKILGALPFNITSPIIHSIVKMVKRPAICVLLVQKEVAEKISQQVPNTSYLSAFVQTFFEVEYLGEIPSGAFRPVPNVEGGILRFTSKNVSFTLDQINQYEHFLHRAFLHPRKMLNKVFSPQELAKAELSPNSRPQEVSPDQWLEFFKLLHLV